MARLVIEPIGLHWLNTDNPEEDLCAHGGVCVTFEGSQLFRTKEDGLSVSTGALYLLRYIETDHLSTEEDHLFPHCAFEMHVDKGEVVNVTGCGHGEDWVIAHADGRVNLRFHNGPSIWVSAQEWLEAVVCFSAGVRDFYLRELKHPSREAQEWFAAFSDEWTERHARALARASKMVPERITKPASPPAH